MRSVIALLLCLVLPSCGASDEPLARQSAQVATASARFPLSEVVQPAIERLEAQLASQAGGELELANPDRILGLLELLAGQDGRMRSIAREEARSLGQRCDAQLIAIIESEEETLAVRGTALEMLALVGGEPAAECLLSYLETSTDAWLRTQAAWRLGDLGLDWVIPRMLLRFKYEKDFQTVIWMAKSLGSLGNHSGLVALQAVADAAQDEALVNSAYERMLGIAKDADFEDVASLWKSWGQGTYLWLDAEGHEQPHSLRYRLEVWKLIKRFIEYQLRGVDDSRFVLQRMGQAAVVVMASALHDQNAYIRVAVAQSLQRMGPRAHRAGPALAEGLGDARLGPWAALALGAIGSPRYEQGQAALLACLPASVDPEIRLSAIRGLAGFAGAPGSDSLRALRSILEAKGPNATRSFEAEEFRQAACESLLALGETRETVNALLRWMTSSTVSPVSTQRALRSWLEAQRELEQVPALIEAWDALSLPDQKVVEPSVRAQVKRDQAQLLREALPGILLALRDSA